MGGLGVTDPYETVDSVGEEKKESPSHVSSSLEITDHVDSTSGWGGMGLRGNHSFTNLHRSASGGSGIFIGEDSDTEQNDTDANNMTKSHGSAGSWASKVGAPSEGYIKTSHMSSLYYRKSNSQGDLASDDANQDKAQEDHRGRPLSASMVEG
jgi:hypothetical protein